MKKIITTIILCTSSMLSHALSINKVGNIEYINKDTKLVYSEPNKDIYLDEVYNLVPDLQDKGYLSNIRSKKEGAALQVVMIGNIEKTGFTKESFSHLLNKEAKVVKEYAKTQQIKGYLFIDHMLLFSKGEPQIPPKDLIEFKKYAECQNGYCVMVNINNIILYNENKEKIEIDKDKFISISKKYENKNILWEINEKNIKIPYSMVTVKLITGLGLGGLDAVDMLPLIDNK